VIIWSFLLKVWITFWCLVCFIIKSFIFMHEGLCWELTMLGLILETFDFRHRIVAAIELHVWLSCNY